MGTIPLSQKGGGAPSPIFGPCLLWPNGWMDQDNTWHGGGPWCRPHCARWAPAPLPQRGTAPQFLAHICCGQMTGWIKMPLHVEVGRCSGDCVRWGPSFPSPKRGPRPFPQFSVNVYCGQMAGWIKMALGMEVGLNPDHIVLDGDPAPLPKKWLEPPSIFGPYLLWRNRWMD